MDRKDEFAVANESVWDRLVEEGCGYTVPWLDLDVDAYRLFREGETDSLPEPFCHDPSIEWMKQSIRGRDLLCLGAGGGQQSAAFSLLGARVTVVEISEGQLIGDRAAADHYGYDVATIHTDMQDLTVISDSSFDLVYGTGLCYIRDVRRVYAEVARVTRPGGLFRVDFEQPAVHFVEWNGQAYCITRPYSERLDRREDGGMEYRHYMEDIFNGLLDAGFAITRVFDLRNLDPQSDEQLRDAPPGSWTHQSTYVAGPFAIIAQKA